MSNQGKPKMFASEKILLEETQFPLKIHSIAIAMVALSIQHPGSKAAGQKCHVYFSSRQKTSAAECAAALKAWELAQLFSYK